MKLPDPSGAKGISSEIHSKKKPHFRELFLRTAAPPRAAGPPPRFAPAATAVAAPRLLTLGAASESGTLPSIRGISNSGFLRRLPVPGVRGPRSRKKILMGSPSQGSTSRMRASKNLL